jgi:hypothetical protein
MTNDGRPRVATEGARDVTVFRLDQEAFERIPGPKRLMVVPGATHLFEEPGAFEEVARLAGDWFARHLGPTSESEL